MVGTNVGLVVVGRSVGNPLGKSVCLLVGESVGPRVGKSVESLVGVFVGTCGEVVGFAVDT